MQLLVVIRRMSQQMSFSREKGLLGLGAIQWLSSNRGMFCVELGWVLQLLFVMRRMSQWMPSSGEKGTSCVVSLGLGAIRCHTERLHPL